MSSSLSDKNHEFTVIELSQGLGERLTETTASTEDFASRELERAAVQTDLRGDRVVPVDGGPGEGGT